MGTKSERLKIFFLSQGLSGSTHFVVSFMVVIAKSPLLVAFLRMWPLLFHDQSSAFSHMLGIMVILSMWLGSCMMLVQKNPLRFMAFLSINHMGFLLVALLAGSKLGVEAIIIDLIVFGLAILVLLSSLRSLDHDDISGLVHKKPELDKFIAEVKMTRKDTIALLSGIIFLPTYLSE